MRVLQGRGGFLGIRGDEGLLQEAGVVILPAPFERSSTYMHGSFRGPAAILDASSELEEYDEELGVEIQLACGGIATLEPLLFITDSGPTAVDRIARAVQALVDRGKHVVCLGGEHTCSLGPMRVFSERFGAALTVLHLDAHSDLRESYRGDAYSHASVMARALEFAPRIVQVGIRAHSEEEIPKIRGPRVCSYDARSIQTGQVPDWQDRVLADLTDKVYLTLDADFFDPSVIPSVGTPEPGGFFWYETLAFLRRVCEERELVGFDFCEFAPVSGIWHPDFTLARLLHKLIGYAWAERPRRVPPEGSP